MDNVSLKLLHSVINKQKDFIVIFHNDNVVVSNKSFNHFLNISSVEEFNSNFKTFADIFVLHPYYFHKEKIVNENSWFDAILELEQNDRIVSILTTNYEPHAFSVEIDTAIPEYKIVTFTDITQSLIKRIMIENKVNIDIKSGAYAKEYFLQISSSYQDAAQFNKKTISTILITLHQEEQKEIVSLTEFVTDFKNIIREDDMLIQWSENTFLLVYLVDSQDKAKQMLLKLQELIKKEPIKKFVSLLKLTLQEDNENIKSLIRRIEE